MAESSDPVLFEKLNEMFFPHFWEKRISLRDSDRKLVHYTSAENALRILSSKTISLRSTVCMNDYSEVQHGHGLVQKCFFENNNDLLNRFVAVFDKVSIGAASEAFKLYDQHFQNNVFRTYIVCLSEHLSTEDETGRLSMWRAYNQGSTGVALVLNKRPLFGGAAFVGFFASPVAYSEVKGYLERVIRSVDENTQFLRGLPRETLLQHIFTLLLFSAICIKHHAFEEEREWRVIYLPALYPSEYMSQSSVTIRSVPQIIYNLPLANIPDKSLTGIEIPEFVERILIGPTQFPYPIFEVLSDALANAGVPDAASRIRASNIPLRT